MGWSYRKSKKLFGGVRINASKNGLGLSVGTKGARVSVNKKGAYMTTSIPGTGLYKRTKIGGGGKQSSYSSSTSQSLPATATNFMLVFGFMAIIHAVIGWLFDSGYFKFMAIVCGVIALIAFIVKLFQDNKKESSTTTFATTSSVSQTTNSQAINENQQSVSVSTSTRYTPLLLSSSNSVDYNEAVKAEEKLFEVCCQLEARSDVKRIFEQYSAQLGFSDCFGFCINCRVGVAALLDVIRCYKNMGAKMETLTFKKKLPLHVLMLRMRGDNSSYLIENESKLLENKTVGVLSLDFLIKMNVSIPQEKLMMVEILRNDKIEETIISEYLDALYTVMMYVAFADGRLSKKETEWLANIHAMKK